MLLCRRRLSCTSSQQRTAGRRTMKGLCGIWCGAHNPTLITSASTRSPPMGRAGRASAGGALGAPAGVGLYPVDCSVQRQWIPQDPPQQSTAGRRTMRGLCGYWCGGRSPTLITSASTRSPHMARAGRASAGGYWSAPRGVLGMKLDGSVCLFVTGLSTSAW